MTSTATSLVIGGASIDTIDGPDGMHHEGICGGNAFFAAAGAAIWQSPGSVAIASRHGDDFPRECLSAFSDAGFDLTGVLPVAGVSSHGFVATYDATEMRTLAVLQVAGAGDPSTAFGNPNPRLDPQISVDQLGQWPDVTAVHVGPIGLEALRANLWSFAHRSVWRQVDPGEESAGWSADERSGILASIDAYLPSEDEVGPTVASTPLEVCREIAAQGPSVIAVRYGRRGSFVFDRRSGRSLHVPVLSVTSVDPTGAGDTYCGGFLAGIALTGDPLVAALLGTVAAAAAVETIGAPSILQRDAGSQLERLRWLSDQTAQPLPQLFGGRYDGSQAPH